MVETVVVYVIVGCVVILAGRSIYRTITGRNGACGCGGGKSCSPSGCCGNHKIVQ